MLLVEHGEEGALGLVLNRPTGVAVADAVPAVHVAVDPDDVVYVGGPVGRDGVMVLAEFEDPHDAALVAFADVGLLPASADLAALAHGVRRARVYAGHAGWGPGQLDAEVEAGGWYPLPARREHVFCSHPDKLWTEVLTAQGGRLALIARMPVDPSLN